MQQDTPNNQPEQEKTAFEGQPPTEPAQNEQAPEPEQVKEEVEIRPEEGEGIPKGGQPNDQQQQPTPPPSNQPAQTQPITPKPQRPKTGEEVENDIKHELTKEIKVDTPEEEKDAEGIQQHSNNNILNQP